MITAHDLQQAIAECQAERNPNANTCIRLAAFLTLQRELFGTPDQLPAASYSFAPAPATAEKSPTLDSGTEFAAALAKKDPHDVWPLIDELVSTVAVVNPPLYRGFMRRLQA